MHTSLHHLALGAQDVASLAEFYRDVVGLEEVARNDEPDGKSLRSVWFKLGGGAVLMIEKTAEAARPRIDGHGSGLFLLALTSDQATLHRRRQLLRDRGIEEERRTDFTRYYRDPEGNRFALSTYQLPS